MEIQKNLLRALELARITWNNSGINSTTEGNTFAILAGKIFDQLIHPKKIRVEIESESRFDNHPATGCLKTSKTIILSFRPEREIPCISYFNL